MGKIHRDRDKCPKCGSRAIMYKHGMRLKAKSFRRIRCTTCNYYLSKN